MRVVAPVVSIGLAAVVMALIHSSAWADECTDLYGTKHYSQAFSICQKQAGKNDSNALFLLGLMHHSGRGALEDQKEAFMFFKRAAKLGHAGAQNNLGYYYFNGLATAQDYKRAFIWFSLASAAGFDDAVTFRDMAAKRLTQEDKLQAQAMAKACNNSKYEMCD